jgi:hypothetical protein
MSTSRSGSAARPELLLLLLVHRAGQMYRVPVLTGQCALYVFNPYANDDLRQG